MSGPSVWRGEQLADSDEWIHEWTRSEIAELEGALLAVQALARPLRRIGRDHCPLTRSTTDSIRWHFIVA